ncbi:amidohydrolase family protein [Paenibacillus contaminans]|uniref:Amidohydrolase-related domain-containing protein n=1 Tax=Paenibacillus contaminans TaxID=450362 RepID=A0A329MNI1_9BACL|nr:amidohydrolase family protein [Paenibacillus contaminans]RAV20856.1 hypothetical protein DQG23_12240 [Paenibacillus contaminans]
MAIDVNCLLGHWPFRKLYKNTLRDLQEVHAANGIQEGYVSSLNSIFYNDCFEGDEELHEMIKGSSYHHVQTIDPAMPGFSEDIDEGVRRFSSKALRIYPTFHGYSLQDPDMKLLCVKAKEHRLPLMITIRMEDERLNHIFAPSVLAMAELELFLQENPEIDVILLNIRYAELQALKETIQTRGNVYFDASGLKDQMFVVEKLLQDFDKEHLLYGSQHPLYCLKSTLLLVQLAEIDEESKKAILGDNGKTVFGGA